MFHRMRISKRPDLRLECADIGDHIPNCIFICQDQRHGAHQLAFEILGIGAANSAFEFSELSGQIPVVHAGDPRRFEVHHCQPRWPVAGGTKLMELRFASLGYLRGAREHVAPGARLSTYLATAFTFSSVLRLSAIGRMRMPS